MQIKEEDENLRYLSKHKLHLTLPKLVKSLQGKKVIIYGAGTLFHLIKKNYDITGLNIVGIADKKYETSKDIETEYGYKVYKLDEIKDTDADCILVTVKFYIPILEDLYERYKNTNIKVKPLVKKSFWTLLKEL